jgi:hypothetical protein
VPPALAERNVVPAGTGTASTATGALVAVGLPNVST